MCRPSDNHEESARRRSDFARTRDVHIGVRDAASEIFRVYSVLPIQDGTRELKARYSRGS